MKPNIPHQIHINVLVSLNNCWFQLYYLFIIEHVYILKLWLSEIII